MKVTACWRLAVRAFEKIRATQDRWISEGIDYERVEISPPPKRKFYPGDVRVATFYTNKIPFLKIYMNWGFYGWEIRSYEIRELKWTNFPGQEGILSIAIVAHSDWRNSPYVDYSYFTDVWTEEALRPPITQRPMLP